MPKTPHALLSDILRAIEVARSSTIGLGWNVYSDKTELQFIVERALTIIGEAVVQLQRQSPDVAQKLTDYRRIISFRNILVHGYADLDQEIVWKVVTDSLPILKAEAESLLKTTKI